MKSQNLIFRLTTAACAVCAVALITGCGSGSASSGSKATTAANPSNSDGQRVMSGNAVSAAVDTTKSTNTLTGTTYSGVISIGQAQLSFQ